MSRKPLPHVRQRSSRHFLPISEITSTPVKGGHYPCLPQVAFQRLCLICAPRGNSPTFRGRLKMGLFFVLVIPHAGPPWLCCTCITLGWISWGPGLIGIIFSLLNCFDSTRLELLPDSSGMRCSRSARGQYGQNRTSKTAHKAQINQF